MTYLHARGGVVQVIDVAALAFSSAGSGIAMVTSVWTDGTDGDVGT